MKYFVQICHPNEIAKFAWKTVDEVADGQSAFESIQSPTFEIFDGLLVRIVDELKDKHYYDGVYNGSSCVDIGRRSEVTKRYPIVYTWRHANQSPWIAFWISCDKPTSIVSTIREEQRVPFGRIVQMLCDVISELPSDTGSDKYINIVREWILRGDNIDKMKVARSHLMSMTDSNSSDSLWVMRYLCGAILANDNNSRTYLLTATIDRMSHIYSESSKQPYVVASQVVASMMKKHLPFSEVIVYITKTS